MGSKRHVTRNVSPAFASTGCSSAYAFCQWKSQRGMSSSTLRPAVPGLSSTRIDVPSRCMCPATRWIVVGRESVRSHVEVVDSLRARAFLPQKKSSAPGTTAARSRTSGRGRRAPRRGCRGPLLALDAGELHRRRQQHRLHRLQAGGRSEREHRARAVGRALVREVVVHLHHDEAALGSETPVPSGRRPEPQPGAQAEIHGALSSACCRRPRRCRRSTTSRPRLTRHRAGSPRPRALAGMRKRITWCTIERAPGRMLADVAYASSEQLGVEQEAAVVVGARPSPSACTSPASRA